MNRHMRWKLTTLDGFVPKSIIIDLHNHAMNIVTTSQDMTFRTDNDDVNSRANIINILKTSMKTHGIKSYAIHATEYQQTGIHVEYDSLDREDEVP